jgi:hypothetical protein
MRLAVLAFLVFAIGCNTTEKKHSSENQSVDINQIDDSEIDSLLISVLKWSDSPESFNLLPLVSDSIDSLFVGFDLEEHQKNIQKLQKTGFFAQEFIDNYNQIILKLDTNFRNGDYGQCSVNEIPNFVFAVDHNPWCKCQDNLDWNTIKTKTISRTPETAEMEWYWAKLAPDVHQSWKDFRYRFKIVKEDGHWKIAYLSGFDFDIAIKKEL